MKYTYIYFLSLTLAVLVSCQNEDKLNEAITANLTPTEQYFSNNAPEGISNLTINETNSKNSSGRGLEEENCITREVSFDQNDSDFFLFDPNSSLLWPGNLLVSRSIQEGTPTSIPIYGESRNPIEVRINVLSGTSVSTYRDIEAPTPGKVQDQLNEVLNNYYDSDTSFPASFDISIERIHNQHQLQFALKAGYSGPSVNLSAQLGVNFNEEKTRYAVMLKQRFFTTSVAAKENIIGPQGWLTESVTPERLSQYVTDYQDVSDSQTNPSAFIESVTYGRLYTMIYESNESALEVEAALKFAYKGAGEIDAELSTRYKQIFQNASVTVKQLGGDAGSGISSSLAALANDLEGVINFLAQGAYVSRQNPGYPISYKVNYVYGNRTFNVLQNISYTVRNCEYVKYDNIRIDPSDVSLHNATDHNTSGAELFGRIFVEKYDQDLGSWYSAGEKIHWGYGVEHTMRDYYPLNGGKREIAPGKVIDFKTKAAVGERFRVISEVDECDASCYPFTDTSSNGRREIVYEYNTSRKKWVDVDHHNIYVDDNNITVGPSFEKRTWNGAWSMVQGDSVVADFWTYILE